MSIKKLFAFAFGLKGVMFACVLLLIGLHYLFHAAANTVLCQNEALWFSPTATLAEKIAAMDAPGTDLDQKNCQQFTGVQHAVATGDYPLLIALLERGADPNIISENVETLQMSDNVRALAGGNTALHLVCLKGDYGFGGTIPALIAAGDAAKPVYGQKIGEQMKNDVGLGMLIALLEWGAHPNVHNKNGDTPLHLIFDIAKDQIDQLQEKRTIFLDLLVNYGANINARNNQNQTILHIAAERGFASWIESLKIPYGSMLIWNAQMSVPLGTRLPEELGFSPRDIGTPQWWAAQNGLGDTAAVFNTVPVIIGSANNNTDVTSTDMLFRTGLMLAILRNDLAFVKDQLDAQADPNWQANDIFGNRPLHYAAASEKSPLAYAQTLLANSSNYKNAAVNLIDKYGNTALHRSIGNSVDRAQIVQLLLDHGADVTIANSDGDTPLHLAAYEEASDVVMILANKFLQPPLPNKAGLTPLQIAEKLHHTGIAQMLMSKGWRF